MPPADVADSDPDLRALQRELRETVAARDGKRLEPLLAAQGVWTSDGTKSPKELVTDFLASPESVIWSDMSKSLRHGFAPLDQDSDVLCAPGAVAMTSLDLLEQFVLGSGVRVRAAARADAPVVTSVTYEAVETLQERVLVKAGVRGEDDVAWQQVRLRNGTEGWMLSSYLWTKGGMVCVERIGGQWRVRGVGYGD